MRDWLPGLAAAVGAKPPYHVRTWLAELLMGEMLPVMTQARGATRDPGRPARP